MKLEKEIDILEVAGHRVNKDKKDVSMRVQFRSHLSDEEMNELFKIKCSQKIKLTLETEKPILDEEERKYLSSVIKPFRNRIKCILKCNHCGNECIHIAAKNKYAESGIWLPPFKKGTMYKGMELNKEYSLEELGL